MVSKRSHTAEDSWFASTQKYMKKVSLIDEKRRIREQLLIERKELLNEKHRAQLSIKEAKELREKIKF